MFGLLGPNGAGKSTFMKALATLIEPDQGAISLGDIDVLRDPTRARGHLGYVPQEFGFHATLSARETLSYFAQLKGVADRGARQTLVDHLLERVNLGHARDQEVGGFSGGMRQRLGIAQALIGTPRLLIVDEPTSGLDPVERARFHELLAETAGMETIVLLSTHIVADVADLCPRVAIMGQGEIRSITTPADAVEDLAGAVWEAVVDREQVARLAERFTMLSATATPSGIRVRLVSRGERPAERFELRPATLEDYYFTTVSARPQS
jgi:ABC-type multidrug transport system ATPase subunit